MKIPILLIALCSFSLPVTYGQSDNPAKVLKGQSISLRDNYIRNHRKLHQNALWWRLSLDYGGANGKYSGNEISYYGPQQDIGGATACLALEVGKNINSHFSVYSGLGLRQTWLTSTVGINDYSAFYASIPVALQYIMRPYKRASLYFNGGFTLMPALHANELNSFTSNRFIGGGLVIRKKRKNKSFFFGVDYAASNGSVAPNVRQNTFTVKYAKRF